MTTIGPYGIFYSIESILFFSILVHTQNYKDMSASSTSSWQDKSEQKVFKCSAKAATKHPFSILVRLEFNGCILEHIFKIIV